MIFYILQSKKFNFMFTLKIRTYKSLKNSKRKENYVLGLQTKIIYSIWTKCFQLNMEWSILSVW